MFEPNAASAVEPLVTYRPFQATPRALVLYGILTALLCAGASFGGPLFSWPPHSELHVIALILLAMLPVPLMQLGWSYVLGADALIVQRFERERFRLPLRDFIGTDYTFAMLRLRFGRRSIWLVSGVDSARQAFLFELQRRAASVGVLSVPQLRKLDHERLRIPLARLSFGHACVACRQPCESRVGLTVQRGYDALLMARFEYVNVQVPACTLHARKRRLFAWLIWLALIPLTIVIAAVLLLTVPGGVLSGALLLGAILAVMLAKPLYAMFGARFLDWLALGVSASALSPDLTEVTLRCRDPRTLLALQAGASEANEEPKQNVAMTV